MRRTLLVISLALAVVSAGHTSPNAKWHMNATAIEACSCPMFCQCYFNSAPAAHSEADVEETLQRLDDAFAATA